MSRRRQYVPFTVCSSPTGVKQAAPRQPAPSAQSGQAVVAPLRVGHKASERLPHVQVGVRRQVVWIRRATKRAWHSSTGIKETPGGSTEVLAEDRQWIASRRQFATLPLQPE